MDYLQNEFFNSKGTSMRLKTAIFLGVIVLFAIGYRMIDIPIQSPYGSRHIPQVWSRDIAPVRFEVLGGNGHGAVFKMPRAYIKQAITAPPDVAFARDIRDGARLQSITLVIAFPELTPYLLEALKFSDGGVKSMEEFLDRNPEKKSRSRSQHRRELLKQGTLEWFH